MCQEKRRQAGAFDTLGNRLAFSALESRFTFFGIERPLLGDREANYHACSLKLPVHAQEIDDLFLRVASA